ncbi:M24 family metallopeptidase [Arthrobacter sp. CG_A4]|uniref:M24 family metallopeptidase n=1 Tax=Arthrobacter sp. CG_A4 TaxID=3071706 RepID=UPI002E0DB2CD
MSDKPTLAWLGMKNASEVFLSIDGEELSIRRIQQGREVPGRPIGLVGSVGAELANMLVNARQGVVNCRSNALAVRRKKDRLEVEFLSRAAAATRQAYESLSHTTEVCSEFQFASELEGHFLRQGGTGRAYETSVATGTKSDRIWSEPTLTVQMFAGGHSVIDGAAEYCGYKADCSLTVGLSPDNELMRAAGVAAGILGKVVELIRDGDRESSRLVEVCNESLRSNGFSDLPHALGHGLGLDLHEYPFIGRNSSHILTAGDVFMIEPAVYIQGVGGVRLESMFRLDSDGELVTLIDSQNLSQCFSDPFHG